MKKRNQIKRSVAVLMVVAMCLCFNNVAFAAETSDTNEQVVVVEPNSGDNGATLEEALEILGITEEEADGSNIYVFDVPVSATSTNGTWVLTPDDYAQLVGEFSFTGSNTGSTLLAFKNAKTAQFGLRWRWLNPDERTCIIFVTRLHHPLETTYFEARGGTGFGDGSYHYTYSEKEAISSDYTYHFEYFGYFGYWAGEDFETPRFEVRVAIQCWN